MVSKLPKLGNLYFIKRAQWRTLKFIYSEKATIFCEISTVDFSYVVTVKSTVEISQNFVAFSEYMNFIILCYQGNVNVAPRWYPYNINRTKKLWYRYTQIANRTITFPILHYATILSLTPLHFLNNWFTRLWFTL